MEINIENSSELIRYLRATRRIEDAAIPTVTVLSGGVSNRTVLIEHAHGTDWVLKQSLSKLRVADDWYCHPARIEREALGLQQLEKLTPGQVPSFVFEDPLNHLFAMTAVPKPHSNWKALLLAGDVDLDLCRQLGELLGRIHCPGRESINELRRLFADRTFFDALRLEPYYRTAAARNPETAAFFDLLINENRSIQKALVHGDFSPKNVLVHQGRLVLLDFEVIHFGDPAFDLGFSLTHLLSKAHHLPPHRPKLLAAAGAYWNSYVQSLPSGTDAVLEERAVRHTLGCLLARVDGRSPLEYLTAEEREDQRRISTELMRCKVAAVPDLIGEFAGRLRD